ncbi:MAG: hypothetical protein K2H70_02175, partial [Bacteroidales bacterium]|nr:hypothetical protein [Bacteroidales bacterium]
CWLDGMDPEAADRLNPMTNEKDFLQAARESGSISRAQLEHPEYLEPVAAGANESYGAVGTIKGWRE